MKPTIAAAARNLAERFRNEIVPELSGFRANNVAMGAAMIDMISEEWDRAAARLFEENEQVRGLLRRGGAEPPAAKNDLRISALETENEVLRLALIELHEALEVRTDDPGRALEQDIWTELRRSVERRLISSANF